MEVCLLAVFIQHSAEPYWNLKAELFRVVGKPCNDLCCRQLVLSHLASKSRVNCLMSSCSVADNADLEGLITREV